MLESNSQPYLGAEISFHKTCQELKKKKSLFKSSNFHSLFVTDSTICPLFESLRHEKGAGSVTLNETWIKCRPLRMQLTSMLGFYHKRFYYISISFIWLQKWANCNEIIVATQTFHVWKKLTSFEPFLKTYSDRQLCTLFSPVLKALNSLQLTEEEEEGEKMWCKSVSVVYGCMHETARTFISD